MLIRPQELEYLLWHCDELQGLLKTLNGQIEEVLKERSDCYALSVKRNLDGMPGSHKKADRTATIALSMGSLPQEAYKAVSEIKKDITLVSMVIDKLELAKRWLSSEEQQIINLKYADGLMLQEIATTLKYSKAQINIKAGQAFARMTQTCRIKLDEYNELQILFERMVNQ